MYNIQYTHIWWWMIWWWDGKKTKSNICIHVYIRFHMFSVCFSITSNVTWLRENTRNSPVCSWDGTYFIAPDAAKNPPMHHRFAGYIASHAYAWENILLRRPRNIDAADNKWLLDQHIRHTHRSFPQSSRCEAQRRAVYGRYARII